MDDHSNGWGDEGRSAAVLVGPRAKQKGRKQTGNSYRHSFSKIYEGRPCLKLKFKHISGFSEITSLTT